VVERPRLAPRRGTPSRLCSCRPGRRALEADAARSSRSTSATTSARIASTNNSTSSNEASGPADSRANALVRRPKGIGHPMAPARQAPLQHPSRAPRLCTLATACTAERHRVQGCCCELPKGEFDRLLALRGADANATTSAGRINDFEMLPARSMELGLFLEADRMRATTSPTTLSSRSRLTSSPPPRSSSCEGTSAPSPPAAAPPGPTRATPNAGQLARVQRSHWFAGAHAWAGFGSPAEPGSGRTMEGLRRGSPALRAIRLAPRRELLRTLGTPCASTARRSATAASSCSTCSSRAVVARRRRSLARWPRVKMSPRHGSRSGARRLGYRYA
jgi:hypothetical protein